MERVPPPGAGRQQARQQDRVRGLRITVQDVLEYLASGMSPEEILEDFPYLEPEDIRACLAYAADRERQTLIGPALWGLLLDENLSPRTR